MPAIQLSSKGDFSKITKYLESLKEKLHITTALEQFGEKGVRALSEATPVDTGETAGAWRYEIEQNKKGATISFHNDHINNGVNIAVILQYGHGTGTGGWVEGRDYINPAIQPIFDEMAEKVWEEVTKV